MVNFVLFSEAAVEDLKDCLEGMLEKDVWVVAGDEFIRNYDQFRIVLNVGCIDGLMVRRYRVFYLLQSIAQTVLKKCLDLIFTFVEDFL